MKPWLSAPFLLALSLHAGAASPDDPVDIGATADYFLQTLDQACKQTSVPGPAAASDEAETQALMAGLMRDLSCTCGPRALQIAYPAAARTGSTTSGAFMVRFSGAMNACLARSVRRVVDAPCGRNVDPFADGTPSSPAVAQARCRCARKELDKAASTDPRRDADAASARYTAGEAAPERWPPFIVMMDAVEKTCSSVLPQKR